MLNWKVAARRKNPRRLSAVHAAIAVQDSKRWKNVDC